MNEVGKKLVKSRQSTLCNKERYATVHGGILEIESRQGRYFKEKGIRSIPEC